MTAKRKRIIIILLCVSALLILTYLPLILNVNSYLTALPDTRAAEAYEDSETTYSQIAVFLPEDYYADEYFVFSTREEIDAAMLENSISAKSAAARLWYDAYSGESYISISNGSNFVNATLTAFGGDYLKIRQLPLVYGSYFSDDTYALDYIILDENLAWQLFGATDVCGMEVFINEKAYLIAGVVSSSCYDEYAYGTTGRAFALYESAAVRENPPVITSYEAVLPNPISDFAKETIENAVASYSDGSVITEVTDRFSRARLFETLKELTKSSVLEKRVKYPFYERAAAEMQTRAAITYFFEIIFGVCGFGTLAAAVIIFVYPYYKKLKQFISDKRREY